MWKLEFKVLNKRKNNIIFNDLEDLKKIFGEALRLDFRKG